MINISFQFRSNNTTNKKSYINITTDQASIYIHFTFFDKLNIKLSDTHK